jgi:putative flavoprotein involved in K+ transport
MRADESAKKWLIEFDAALQKQDIDKAVDMFHAESYWRDLVSFTWNLKTAEGR